MDQIHILLKYLLKDCADNSSVNDVLTYVLIDKSRMDYPNASEVDSLDKQGIRILGVDMVHAEDEAIICLLYTSPSPRDRTRSRMPSSA